MYVAETVSVPVAVGVMLTEQEPATRVQLPPGVKVTVPVGVVFVPGAVSATAAEHEKAIRTVPVADK